MSSQLRRASKAVRFRAGACAASPRVLGASRPFPFCTQLAFSLAHVTPLGRTKNEEKTMTTINFTLLLTALAQLLAAIAALITAIRHR